MYRSEAQALARVLQWGNVNSLVVDEASVIDPHLLAICQSCPPQLTSVDLIRSEISDQGLAHISRLCALTTLRLLGSYSVTDEGLDHITA